MPDDILLVYALIASPMSPIEVALRPLLLAWWRQCPTLSENEASDYRASIDKALAELFALSRSDKL
jgi:hypothetical protein